MFDLLVEAVGHRRETPAGDPHQKAPGQSPRKSLCSDQGDNGSGDAPAADDTGGDTGGDDESGEADAGSVYDAFTVADLRDEIRGRNEGREPDQRVSLDGNKADLVAALEADDAAQG